MTFWETIAISISCSFIASFFFLFFVLVFFKPKISISPFVCARTYNSEGATIFYTVKFVNHSWHSAYDVKIELHQLEKISVGDHKQNDRLTSLSIVKDNVSNIAPYRPSWIRKKANHCIIFRTREDIVSILTDEHKTIIAKITLRHGLTGLVRVFTKEYCDTAEVKNGKFSYGTKFGLLN